YQIRRGGRSQRSATVPPKVSDRCIEWTEQPLVRWRQHGEARPGTKMPSRAIKFGPVVVYVFKDVDVQNRVERVVGRQDTRRSVTYFDTGRQVSRCHRQRRCLCKGTIRFDPDPPALARAAEQSGGSSETSPNFEYVRPHERPELIRQIALP